MQLSRTRPVLALALLCLSALPVAAARAERIYAVTSASNTLISFDSATPGTTTAVGPISRLGAGESVVGMDIEPSTGRLFAVTSASRLYVVSKTSGAATPVGSAAFAPALSGTRFGVDFDPVAGVIRITSDSAQNLRLSPVTGAVVGNDTPLNPAPVNVVASAYTDNVAGATQTTLYSADSGDDMLKRQGSLGGMPTSPNTGTLVPVKAAGVDIGSQASMDISGASNIGYLVAQLQIVPGTSYLITFNLTDFSPSIVGQIGSVANDVVGMTAEAPGPSIRLAQGGRFAATENGTSAAVTISRGGDLGSASSVSFQTTGGGTATPGSDFTAVGPTLVSFPAGVGAQTVQVPILQDAVAEPAETINVAISGAVGASLGSPGTGVITLVDDDRAADHTKPVVALSAPTIARLSAFGTTGLPLRFSCNEKCSATTTLKAGSRLLGSGSARLARSGSARVRVRLSAAGRRFLATKLPAGSSFARRRVTAILKLSVADAARNTRILTRKLTLRR